MDDIFETPEAPAVGLTRLHARDPVPDLGRYTMGDLAEFVQANQVKQSWITKNQIRPGSYPDNSVLPQKLAAVPACRVYASAAQTIPHATVTYLSFDSEVFDVAGCHDSVTHPGRLSAPISGVYVVGAQVALPATGAGVRQLWGQINAVDSTSNRFVEHLSEGVGTEWRTSVNGVVKLAAGDWVAFSVFQTSGGSVNTNYYGVTLRAEAWMAWTGNY